ncbi:hypothetical protein [Anaerosacchariphilus polymeriproducens]|uniref:hypothetical protein n=1 Tax=Anaerosacchariphilus polymeriproducens TaxID=1812858 RepID=UPI0011C061E3|nr:hypothetical protein [Anaerosacchariphilus polymeriproducens]
MSVEVYKLISNIGFVSAGIMLILSIVLFIKFKIPKVYADLSGTAAKKEIEGISEKNAQERGRSRKLSPFQYQKGKTSEMVSIKGKNKNSDKGNKTVSNETEILDTRNQSSQQLKKNTDNFIAEDFIIEDDIVFIHTDEIIL